MIKNDMAYKTTIAARQTGHGTLLSYIVGFILSLAFTIIPYEIVVNKVASGWTLMGILGIFAIAQLMVQLVFFLHIGDEKKPRWNFMVFLFMVMVVAIVAIGSLWIMYNLDYHMMSGPAVDHKVMEDEGIRR